MNPLEERVDRLAAALLARGSMIATAESCTGGLIAAACTGKAGSSAWFERGFVTYSNAAKHEMLGVPVALIEGKGAVSEEVAAAMAEGALVRSTAAWSTRLMSSTRTCTSPSSLGVMPKAWTSFVTRLRTCLRKR